VSSQPWEFFSQPSGSTTTQEKNEMAPLAPHRKRKQTVIEQSDASDSEHFPDGGLDLLSGDEDEDGPAQESDNDDVDAFPEIDAGSDTDEEDERSSGDNEDRSESEGEEQDDEDASDDDLHIFPRAKTVISDITGRQKKVYPEIEPDYDSDSSTEDVRASPTFVVPF
jgi:ribosome biogenesis protein ERB1